MNTLRNKLAVFAWVALSSILLQSCIIRPLEPEWPRGPRYTESTDSGDPESQKTKTSTYGSDTGTEEVTTTFVPTQPCKITKSKNGVSKLTVYLGWHWDSNAYWPREDGAYEKASIIQFPAEGGTLDIEVVNYKADFSLYITGYNANVVKDVYSFVEDGYFAGVMSFSQYGCRYDCIPYRLVVEPNGTGHVIYPFCDAHWTAIRDASYLGEFHICCKQLAGAPGESHEIEIVNVQ